VPHTVSSAEFKLELGILQSLADAYDIFLSEDFPFLQKMGTLSRLEALPMKTWRKRRNKRTCPPACFRRPVLGKRNCILRTRQIVSGLLPWRTAVKAKHFSVRIMIT